MRSVRARIAAGVAVALTVLAAACGQELTTQPSASLTPPSRMAPAPRAAHDRDSDCVDQGGADILLTSCDSTAATSNRSGYLVAAGRKYE